MIVHDPLTCPDCSPEPWAQAELTHRGRTRRFTGWAAVAIVMAPFAAMTFMLGVLVGIVLEAVTR